MVAGGIGTVLTAGYFLWTLQRVNLGHAARPVEGRPASATSLTVEWLAWVPLLVADRGPRACFRGWSSAYDRGRRQARGRDHRGGRR